MTVVSSAFVRLPRSSIYICTSCARRYRSPTLSLKFTTSQRRYISQNWLRKTEEAKAQWSEKAKEIKGGRQKSMLSILEERGYVNTIVGDRDKLDDLIIRKRIGVYAGFDPTAPSLHVGHLLPLMTLFWFYVHGMHSVSLLGGATAQIGDPTGRLTPRETQHSSIRKANMASMHMQLKKLWLNVEIYARKYNYNWEWAWRRELVNNNAWLNKQPMIEVLKLLGPGVRIGTMLGRDTVRKKMESGDGMSFAEFTYPLVQAWDWWYMYHTKGIQLQIGGSDQFGNIVTGIDAIKYIAKNHYDPLIRQEKDDDLSRPVGFTVPLLTTASGEKFGKSAGNAIWLDPEMTSSFDLYQFFLRSADADVSRYLKLFTFIPLDDIHQIVVEHERDPSKRIAQHRLASDAVAFIHGQDAANEAASQHGIIFNAPLASKPRNAKVSHNTDVSNLLNPHAPITTSSNAPSIHVILPESLVRTQSIARVLWSAGLVSSRSEGNRLAVAQGAYVGSRPGKHHASAMGDGLDFSPAKNWKPEDTDKYIIDGNLLILRVGKWKVKIIRIVSDAEFEELGLDAPGWKEDKKPRRDEDVGKSEKPKSSTISKGSKGRAEEDRAGLPPTYVVNQAVAK